MIGHWLDVLAVWWLRRRGYVRAETRGGGFIVGGFR